MSNQINILAIDTSTDACSVALYSNGKITEHFDLVPRAHAQLILPMIDALLNAAGILISQVDAFAFGRGPGSFTGVRIACSVIQALSFGTHKPVIAVSTLQALAEGAYQKMAITQALASLDARMQEIYWGLFEIGTNGIMEPAGKESVSPESLALLPSNAWQRVTGFPHAEDIARIAAVEYRLGNMVSAEAVLPIYIRDEVAKKPSE